MAPLDRCYPFPEASLALLWQVTLLGLLPWLWAYDNTNKRRPIGSNMHTTTTQGKGLHRIDRRGPRPRARCVFLFPET